jgi:hypothetical protein
MAISAEMLQQQFKEYLTSPDREKEQSVWKEHQNSFQQFWKTKIMRNTKSSSVSETADYDPIIKLIDIKARGFNRRTDIAVAHVGLYQGTWHRIFNDLVEKKDIKETLNQIFNTTNVSELVKLVDRFAKQNEQHKNGLTGKRANAINALLVLNDPNRFISCVSLKHRFWILKAFGLGNPDRYKSYGQQVILSNEDILGGLKNTFGLAGTARDISVFLYKPSIKELWFVADSETPAAPSEDGETSIDESEFAIEKHLEDFLIANWEKTDLGRRYELIEQDGELASQQYPTKVGTIDLLVRDKKSKDYVVIELKKGQSGDQTAGQLARYMGWVRENLAKGKKVQGLVIANSIDEKLRLALSENPNAAAMTYKVNFTLERAK